MKTMKNSEINAINLKLLMVKANLNRKSLGDLYKSRATVYQHLTGRRGIGEPSRRKYIEIFKLFGMEVTDHDFFLPPNTPKLRRIK